MKRRIHRSASRLVDIASTYDTEPVEWAVALWMLLLGLHSCFFDFVHSSPSYAYHADVPRCLHAVVKLTAGALVLTGLASTRYDGSATRTGLRRRRLGAVLAVVVLVLSATAFLVANPASGAGPTTLVGAMMAAWCRVRLRLDGRAAFHRH